MNCSNTDLVDAHIIPKGFGRIIRGPGRNIVMSLQDVRDAQPPLGEFDRNILCAACDNKLGYFDDYAIEVCRKFETKRIRSPHRSFEYRNFEGERFTKFVLAVLWRASISKRDNFEEISLGPYEDQARDVLFGAAPLAQFKPFQVIVQRYTSPHLNMKGIYSLPKRAPFTDLNLNTYGFMLSGFRILAKVDSRPLPAGFKPFITNVTQTLRGLFVEFEKTPEFERVKDAAVNHLIRTKGRGLDR